VIGGDNLSPADTGFIRPANGFTCAGGRYLRRECQNQGKPKYLAEVWMRFFYTLIFFLAFTAFISWLNHRLLARMFPVCRTRVVRQGYLFLTAAAVLVAVFGWPRRTAFTGPGGELFSLLIYASLVWLGGQLFLALLQPLLYAAHRLIHGKRAPDDGQAAALPAMTRRVFLHKTLAAVPLVAFGSSVEGVYEAQSTLEVVRHTLAMPALPASLDGFKIGQLSDAHLGPYFSLARLNEVLGRLAAEKPDLVVVTGDLIDDLHLLEPAAAALAALGAAVPHGVYFCWGNHDYFYNPRLIRTSLTARGIKILTNRSALITPGDRPFCLLGVDYPTGHGERRSFNVDAGQRAECFAAASRDVPSGAFCVLIAHHPNFLENGFAARMPLTLAGHTHGGQVVIGGKSLLALNRYVRGLYRENGVYGYVSSGAGQWFPFRLGCPPEISVFTLRA
jgi:Predicted phosphohydrolases